ncbi:unnamed protein product [Amoebophrya sp. A120]|nr:unnamed protein product [Amoebophrya sp. A120]|eukprot:GSA120T00016482001.1
MVCVDLPTSCVFFSCSMGKREIHPQKCVFQNAKGEDGSHKRKKKVKRKMKNSAQQVKTRAKKGHKAKKIKRTKKIKETKKLTKKTKKIKKKSKKRRVQTSSDPAPELPTTVSPPIREQARKEQELMPKMPAAGAARAGSATPTTKTTPEEEANRARHQSLTEQMAEIVVDFILSGVMQSPSEVVSFVLVCLMRFPISQQQKPGSTSTPPVGGAANPNTTSIIDTSGDPKLLSFCPKRVRALIARATSESNRRMLELVAKILPLDQKRSLCRFFGNEMEHQHASPGFGLSRDRDFWLAVASALRRAASRVTGVVRQGLLEAQQRAKEGEVLRLLREATAGSYARPGAFERIEAAWGQRCDEAPAGFLNVGPRVRISQEHAGDLEDCQTLGGVRVKRQLAWWFDVGPADILERIARPFVGGALSMEEQAEDRTRPIIAGLASGVSTADQEGALLVIEPPAIPAPERVFRKNAMKEQRTKEQTAERARLAMQRLVTVALDANGNRGTWRRAVCGAAKVFVLYDALVHNFSRYLGEVEFTTGCERCVRAASRVHKQVTEVRHKLVNWIGKHAGRVAVCLTAKAIDQGPHAAVLRTGLEKGGHPDGKEFCLYCVAFDSDFARHVGGAEIHFQMEKDQKQVSSTLLAGNAN